MIQKVTMDLYKLEQLRQEKRLSISQVSAALGYKTPTGYWLVERGERKVSVQVLYGLSRLFEIPMEDLLIPALVKD